MEKGNAIYYENFSHSPRKLLLTLYLFNLHKACTSHLLVLETLAKQSVCCSPNNDKILRASFRQASNLPSSKRHSQRPNKQIIWRSFWARLFDSGGDDNIWSYSEAARDQLRHRTLSCACISFSDMTLLNSFCYSILSLFLFYYVKSYYFSTRFKIFFFFFFSILLTFLAM